MQQLSFDAAATPPRLVKTKNFVVLIYASASKFDIGEGTTRATCVHHQQPQRQQQQQEGEEKASKCKNSRK